MRTIKLFKRVSSVSALLLGAILVLAPAANAMKLKKQNLQQLTDASQSIISGQVIKVTDGFDKTRPFTEITIKISADAKGKHADNSTYTFRQFGLLKPRSMGNGKVYIGVTPEGFAKWNEGEHIVAFMYKKASITGFQTTAGMAQGKFVVRNGKVENVFANIDLFEGMDTANFSAEEANMLTAQGAVDSTAFFALVSKLVGVEK